MPASSEAANAAQHGPFRLARFKSSAEPLQNGCTFAHPGGLKGDGIGQVIRSQEPVRSLTTSCVIQRSGAAANFLVFHRAYHAVIYVFHGG